MNPLNTGAGHHQQRARLQVGSNDMEQKRKIGKLMEFRTMEESERGVIGIYVPCMGVLLYTHRGMEAWRGICC